MWLLEGTDQINLILLTNDQVFPKCGEPKVLHILATFIRFWVDLTLVGMYVDYQMLFGGYSVLYYELD